MAVSTDINKALLEEVVRVCNESESIILEEIAKRADKAITGTYVEERLDDLREMRTKIQSHLDRSTYVIKSKVSQGIIDAYRAGGLSAKKDMGVKLAETAMEAVHVPDHIQRLVLETNKLIDGTSVQILRNTDDAYRQVISQTSMNVLSGVYTPREAMQASLNSFAAKGISGFTDKAGRKWDLASYTEMATRTTTARAALQGHIDNQTKFGNDLVKVSSIGVTCPICARWQGRALSISGKTPGYPALEEARADGLFHPNCKHTIMAFFPGLSEESHEDADDDLYEKTQEQRYNERQIRKWKRVESVALTPEAAAAAKDKVSYWQARQRQLIDETGLRRQYARESIKGWRSKGDASLARPDMKTMVLPAAGSIPAPKVPKLKVAKPKPEPVASDDLTAAIKRYTTGGYKTFNEQADNFLSGKEPKDKAFSKPGVTIFDAVTSSTEKFDTLYRIESAEDYGDIGEDGFNPFEEGQKLTWGLRSTSTSEKFIAKAAKGLDENLPFVGGDSYVDSVVFRLRDEKGLDVSKISPFDQSEVIVSGEFEVVNTGTVEKIAGKEVFIVDVQRVGSKPIVKHIAENKPEPPVPIIATVKDIPTPTLDHFEENWKKWRDTRPNRGKADEQMYDTAVQKLKDVVKDAKLRMRIKSRDFEKIVDSGRLKNQFETGTSGGLLGDSNVDYKENARFIASNEMFGTTLDVPGKDLEKYGYLWDDDNGMSDLFGDVGMQGQYGNIIFEFKDSMRSRTTMTISDSLGANVIPSKLTNIRRGCFKGDYNARKLSLKNFNGISDVVETTVGDYIEAQYHGAITLDDIDTVYVKRETLAEARVNDKYLSDLQNKGIKVKVVWPEGFADFDPNINYEELEYEY